MPRFTRTERLNELQQLHTIYMHAASILDKRYPKDFADDGIAREASAIKHRASDAFFSLTGFFPFDVSMTELNNTAPSVRIAQALRSRTVRGGTR